MTIGKNRTSSHSRERFQTQLTMLCVPTLLSVKPVTVRACAAGRGRGSRVPFNKGGAELLCRLTGHYLSISLYGDQNGTLMWQPRRKTNEKGSDRDPKSVSAHKGDFYENPNEREPQ
jgi:hypothetical protein